MNVPLLNITFKLLFKNYIKCGKICLYSEIKEKKDLKLLICEIIYNHNNNLVYNEVLL